MAKRSSRSSRRSSGNATSRMIRNVLVVRGDADDVAAHLKDEGLHPRVYERMARAENLTIPVWIVVCDRT